VNVSLYKDVRYETDFSVCSPIEMYSVAKQSNIYDAWFACLKHLNTGGAGEVSLLTQYRDLIIWHECCCLDCLFYQNIVFKIVIKSIFCILIYFKFWCGGEFSLCF
jgi:hypothetical protein